MGFSFCVDYLIMNADWWVFFCGEMMAWGGGEMNGWVYITQIVSTWGICSR